MKLPEEEPNEADTTVASEASGVGSAEIEAEVEVDTTAEVEASTEAEAADGDQEASVPDVPASQEAIDGDLDASTAEMTASQGPRMDFSNAAHLAFWLPLLSDHLVRSGYLTQCAVPPWSTQSQASGRRGWKARKAPAAEGGQPVGPDLLLQACWDHHSPGGCTRDTCRWQHFALDKWQSSWLRLQRFCFGAQLATFSSLGELKQAVEDAFSNEERLAANAPGNLFGALRSSLLGLKHLGYPFKAPVTSDGSDGTDDEEGDDCVAVGKGRAGLLKSVKALAGFTRPGCQVLPVGSFAWGIDIEGSDLDVVVATGKSESDSDVLTAICHKLQKLQAKGKAPRGLEAAHCVVYGVGTSMPVLAIRTFQDGEPLDVDMCTVGNLSSVRDAILFRHYFELLPRLPEVLQLLKRWLRLRALPTSSEGGYPQIFWMRLAARTFQTVGGPGEASAEQARDDVDLEVRQLLRGFCAQWSQSLPSWGSLMNLVGEEPSPFLKRLPAGVYGATALLFLRELTILSKTPTPEDLPRLPPQTHLCPAKAGFWAAFLIPALSDEAAEEPSGHSPVSGSSALLVSGRVTACVGQQETIRYCYARPEEASGQPRPGGDAQSAGVQRYEFISRKDSDWVMLVDVNWKEACDVGERRCKSMALLPQHFVCTLDGDPTISTTAAKSMRELQDLALAPAVKVGLPSPYPLYRYTRRVLLSTFARERTKSKPTETPKARVRKSGRGRKYR